MLLNRFSWILHNFAFVRCNSFYLAARFQSRQSSFLLLHHSQPLYLHQANVSRIVNCKREFHVAAITWKAKKGKTGAAANKIKQLVNPSDVEEFIDLLEVQRNLENIITTLQEDLAQNFRVGTDLAVFEQLTITVDDEVVNLTDVGQIVKASPRLVTIDMVAFPECISLVLKALQESSLNTNPTVSGSVIKVPVAQATAEYRRDLVKKVKHRVGECKSELHNLTTKTANSTFALEGASIDVKTKVAEQLKLYAQYYVSQAEAIGKTKETALLKP